MAAPPAARPEPPTTAGGHIQQAGRARRDYQKRRLYKGEARFMEEPPAAQQRFADVGEARRWAEALAASDEFRSAYPEAAAHLGANPLEVRRSTAKHKVGSAATGGSRIRLSAHDDGKGMVLPAMVHEMSHIVHGNAPTGYLAGSQPGSKKSELLQAG